MDRLIINVRVSKARRRYATYTDKRQLGIISDMLDWKWGNGIEIVKEEPAIQKL